MTRSQRKRLLHLQMSPSLTTAARIPWLIPYRDIQVLKTYGAAPYAAALKKLEKDIKEKQSSVNEKIGVKVLEIALLWSAQPD
jgi:hypothetical protein